MTLLVGAVAYDPKTVTIWAGFRSWLAERGSATDFVLYSHYERQVEDLVAGRIQVAWNSPLAWLRARRLAAARGVALRPLLMRDTDRDLTSVVVVRHDSPHRNVTDLKDTTVAVGALDSPQATLIPLSHLNSLGLRPHTDFRVARHDVGVGLHGDHIGGERDAVRALLAGRADAACLLDADHLLFGREGTVPVGATCILTQTARYDHCLLVAGETAPPDTVDRLAALLLSMSYADPDARRLLDLEGMTAWCPARTEGHAALDLAVRESGFYDAEGRVTAREYRP
ncbi:phosphate/phosphite/phosphonate ABC transporter substrate-binding protein [Streptomyces sp. NPDC056835]|uniref:phosphate/phosphite/phosphonate ABC transporter substrate-binding protein n=1 Tax=Streptomyces sp. NPDC056835 TaxID=3345956 RepID=UPI003698EC7A